MPPPPHVPVYTDPTHQSTHSSLFTDSLTLPIPRVLPPGVSQDAFDAAILRYEAIVGAEHVLLGDALVEYIDPYEVNEGTEERKVPCAAVRPGNLEEVRRVLGVCGEVGVPVWTVSRGKNLGYGGPAPRLPSSLTLDLHRLSRILHISTPHAYALLEPGVTFSDLYTHLTTHNIPLWPSVPSLGWGSVIGNTLDRGTGFTPTATHHQYICGLEVMLADGSLVRTGQWGIGDDGSKEGSGSPSAHLSKFSFGPSVEGLFLQSNLGIVTKMGIWLTPAPETYMACRFSMPQMEDVGTMVEVFGQMRRGGTMPDTVYVSNFLEYLGMVGQRRKFWEGEGAIPEWRLSELMEEIGVGYWNARFGLYGAREVVKGRFEAVKRILGEKAGKGKLEGKLYTAEEGKVLVAGEIPEEDGGFFVGVPSLWSLPMVKFRVPEAGGVGAHYDFSPIIPTEGGRVEEWVGVAKRICEAHSFDLFCDFFLHERHLIFVNMLPFDKTNASHRSSVQAIFHELFEEGKKRGYSKYRSHVNSMDLVASLYDFNNYAYRRFVEKIKDAVDPKGILSPGKQGIWGTRWQEYRKLKGKL